jgi:hypothetical protein
MSTETLVECHSTTIPFSINSFSTNQISSSEFEQQKQISETNLINEEKIISIQQIDKTCSSSTSSSSCMTFRLKSGKVETEKPIGNQWAGQCQSKVFLIF